MGLYTSPSLLLREASEVPFLSMLLMSWQPFSRAQQQLESRELALRQALWAGWQAGASQHGAEQLKLCKGRYLSPRRRHEGAGWKQQQGIVALHASQVLFYSLQKRMTFS